MPDIVKFHLSSGRMITVDFNNPASIGANQRYAEEVREQLSKSIIPENKNRLTKI